jgi:hypothetical protein
MTSLIMQILLSLIFVTVLKGQRYWLGLAIILVVYAIKFATDNYVRKSAVEGFISTTNSTLSVAVTFIILAAFGISDMVTWGIVLPLLVTSYLIGYMGLRIGIATKSSMPASSSLETVGLPVVLIINIAVAAIVTNAHHINTLLSAILLATMTYLTLQRARLAYVKLQNVKL